MAKRKLFEKEEKDVEEVKEEVLEPSTEVVEEPVKEEVKEEVKKDKTGKLVDCELLNARKESKKDSEILFVIGLKDKIKILDEENDFYKVEVNGKEAYCMKNFIKVK